MSKHTKGYWVLGSDKTKVLSPPPGRPGPFRLVADTFSPRCVDGTGDHSLDGPEMMANARLIAAAPELLEALKFAYGMIPAPDMGKDLRAAEKLATLAYITEAIAKAEGK